jgi:hypothetical protein
MDEKFEYKFVQVDLDGGYWTGSPNTGYREDIMNNAKNGWRFVQAFAPPVGGYGKASKVDLIFERKLSS